MTTSLVEPVTANARGPVVRYAAVATTARLGDAGAGIGVVLLAVDRDGATHGALVGGLLAASLTAPHVLGPWTGRLLDGGRSPRRVLTAACLVFATALAVGTALLAFGPVASAAPAFFVAGTAGPLLTGGFSSLVAGLGGDTGRARGIDALTYGIAGTAGPAAVAALAAVASPATSLLVLSVVVAAAAPATALLPVRSSPRPAQSARSARATRATRPAPPPRDRRSGAGLLFRSEPLRTVTVVTMAAAAAGGASTVVAVLLSTETTGSARAGAWLVAAAGIGNLAGALAVTLRPWRGDPVRYGLVVAAALGVTTAAVAVVTTVVVGLVVFAVIGVLTAVWVTATLYARDRLADPDRRGQVFAAMSGLKVAAGSGGTALAGVVSGWGARPLALAAGTLVVVTVVVGGACRRTSDPGRVRASG